MRRILINEINRMKKLTGLEIISEGSVPSNLSKSIASIVNKYHDKMSQEIEIELVKNGVEDEDEISDVLETIDTFTALKDIDKALKRIF